MLLGIFISSLCDNNQYTMMKFCVLLSLACAVMATSPPALVLNPVLAPALESSYDLEPDGTYKYTYLTEDGVKVQVEGLMKDKNTEHASLEVHGSYVYKSPSGEPVSISYVANELGYQPQGDVLPTPPPVPPMIARSLEWIAQHPSKEEQPLKPVPAYSSGKTPLVATLLG